MKNLNWNQAAQTLGLGDRTEELVRRTEQTRLKLASSIGVRPPQLEIVDSDDIAAHADRHQHKIIVSSALLLRPWRQVEWVIAHEMAHLTQNARFRWLDIAWDLSLKAVVLSYLIILLFSGWTMAGMAIAALAGMMFLGGWTIYVERFRRKTSFAWEHEADLIATRTCGMEGLELNAALFAGMDREHVQGTHGYNRREALRRGHSTHPLWQDRVSYVRHKLLPYIA